MNRRSDDVPDYYRILGVVEDATPAEITAAFHALARKHHPDTAEHNDPSSKFFKAIVEAYEVLGDPRRRREYDRCPARRRVGGFARESHVPPTNSMGRGSPVDLTPLDIFAELPIAPEEARYGGPCEIRITRYVRCTRCDGSGVDQQRPCRACQALGRTSSQERVVIQVPSRIRSGAVLCLPQHGHEQMGPAEEGQLHRGTLFLRIAIRPCW